MFAQPNSEVYIPDGSDPADAPVLSGAVGDAYSVGALKGAPCCSVGTGRAGGKDAQPASSSAASAA